MTKKEIIIGIVFLLIGIVGTYLVERIKIAESRQLTIKTLITAGERAIASQSLNSTCSQAYTIVSTCLSNLKTCNLSQEAQKLDKLNLESAEATKKIDETIEETKTILRRLRNGKAATKR